MLWTRAHNACRENLLENLCNLREVVDSIKPMLLSRGIILPAEPNSAYVGSSVCFAAGGFACDSFLDLGLCLSSASALFWSDGKLSSGAFTRDMSLDVLPGTEALSNRASLLSDTLKLKNALSAIKKTNASSIVIDFSLHEAYTRNPLPFKEYELYRRTLIELLSFCHKNSITPVGVSRGVPSVVFRNYIKDLLEIDLPDALSDNLLLGLLGEKYPFLTGSFFPTSQFELKELGSGFKTSYLAIKSTAMPLRIDIPRWACDLDSVFSFILRSSKNSGYPLPLYLASMDSMVTENDLRSNAQKLAVYLSNVGGSVLSDIARSYNL